METVSVKPPGLHKPHIILSLVQLGKEPGCSQRLGAFASGGEGKGRTPGPEPESLTAEGRGSPKPSAPSIPFGQCHTVFPFETTGLPMLNAASFRK